MKVCRRGWEYAQISDENGTVEICSWATANYKPIGSLSKSTMYEIWHGALAESFRDSLRDGSYRYCEKQRCPWMANGTLEEHMKEYDDVPEYPKDISLSYERACNYRCTCCADSENCGAPRSKDADKNRIRIESELDKFLPSVTTISANGRGELFASPSILRRLQSWNPKADMDEIEVILETNGALFDEMHWRQIENLGKYDLKLTITVMGFDESTYQFLSGTSLPVANIIRNLHFARELREQGIVNCFEIGTVVQERNFREMPTFVRRCIEEFQVDIVRLRSYFPFGDGDPAMKWFYDIRNPKHPYYKEYVQVMADQIFSDPHVMMWSGEELSNQGENPYQKDRDNFEVIRWFAVDAELPQKLADYMKRNGINNFAIYGWGFAGEALMQALEKGGMAFDFIIDNGCVGEVRKGLTIFGKSDIHGDYKGSIIVTSPFYFREIKESLAGLIDEGKIINIASIMQAIEG